MNCEAFFIIGCGRSATTAFARILGTATNGEAHVEQVPKLQIESRDLLKGILKDPGQTLFSLKNPAVEDARQRGKIYGDKSPTYLPFIPNIFENWQSRIIFLTRDGRDVVRSSMNWIEYYKSNGFAMVEDDPQSSRSRPEEDLWDYSRLRPNPGEPYFAEWRQLSRFEKFSWLWANFNALALRLLEREDRSRWMQIDVSTASTATFEEVFSFLGLSGFDGDQVNEMLRSRINSAVEKTGHGVKYPAWENWTDEQRGIFDRHAAGMMKRLGYDGRWSR
jgi:hypothetical protein